MTINPFKRLFSPTIGGIGAVLLYLTSTPAFAQGPLRLEDCVALALRNNLSLLSEELELEERYARFDAARGPFEISADMRLTVPSYNDSRDLFEDQALTTRFREESTNFSYNGNMTLSQRYKGIGQFALIAQGARQELNSNRRQNFTDISGDLIFSYSHQILTQAAEEVQLDRARADLGWARSRSNRRKLEIEDQVTAGYYSLVQSIRQLDILEKRLNQSRSSVETAQNKFEIGLIAEVEVLRLKVDLLSAEADYASQETQIDRNRDGLLILLGMDLHEPLEVVTDIDVNFQKYPISMRRALEVGLSSRTDLLQSRMQEEISRSDLKLIKERLGISAIINASVGMRGRGDEIGDVSRNFERNNISASLRLDIPLIDGGEKRNEIREWQIRLEQRELSTDILEQQVIQQIRNAVRGVRDFERQVELRLAALDVAEKTYDVEESRFELGLAESQALLNAQADLTDTRTLALQAIISYQRQLMNLRLATMAELDQLLEESPE